MADTLLAIVVSDADDPNSLLATAATSLPEGTTVARTFTEDYSGSIIDQRDELQGQLDKLGNISPVFPPSYMEYRGGLSYPEALTVLGWYGVYHADADGVVDEADSTLAEKIAPPGTDPLDPPAEEPDPDPPPEE